MFVVHRHRTLPIGDIKASKWLLFNSFPNLLHKTILLEIVRTIETYIVVLYLILTNFVLNKTIFLPFCSFKIF